MATNLLRTDNSPGSFSARRGPFGGLRRSKKTRSCPPGVRPDDARARIRGFSARRGCGGLRPESTAGLHTGFRRVQRTRCRYDTTCGRNSGARGNCTSRDSERSVQITRRPLSSRYRHFGRYQSNAFVVFNILVRYKIRSRRAHVSHVTRVENHWFSTWSAQWWRIQGGGIG